MAKLRHLVLSVPDIERTAQFYVSTFGLDRVGQATTAYAEAVYLSDGVMNLTLLHYLSDAAAGDERGAAFVGLHHMGFVVDDVDEASRIIEANGGAFHKELKGGSGANFERKFRDPDGIVFDISGYDWAGSS